jgi:protein-tyrosine phosphatase
MGVAMSTFDAPRIPVLAGASNFRDLAERVHPMVPMRPGLVFRSDHLGNLSHDDIHALQAIGLRRVIDFRGVQERQSAACALPEAKVHALTIEPSIVQVLSDLIASGHRPTAAEVQHHMQDTYRGFVRGASYRFAEFFGHLLESAEPTVFHCTAGKDRTGLAAALFLHALGASREQILDDYLLTNQRLRPPAVSGGTLDPVVAQVLRGVESDFLQAAYDAINTDHGSIDRFLDRGLGVGEAERRQLRTLYLVR